MCQRRGGNVAIGGRYRLALCTCLGAKLCVSLRSSIVKRQDASGKQGQDALLQAGVQHVSALASWQRSHAKTQLGQTDGGEIQRFNRLRIDLIQDRHIPAEFQRLRNNVGIQKNHSKLNGAVGDGSRTMSRSAPPACCPISASKEPSLMRPSGRTALSRIARTSASVLRPAVAARTRKARCVSSGKLRHVPH